MTPQRLGVVFCLLLAHSDAQTTAPPTSSPSTQTGAPLIRITARLLQVSVVVLDRNGEPVSHLKKEDFVLYDQGVPQQIRYFNEEGNQPQSDYPPDEVAGVASNRFVTSIVDGKVRVQPLPNSVTAILLDGLNTRFKDQVEAKEALIRFLKQLRPGDRVAIYTLTDSLRVLHDFTSDISSLLAALDRHPIRESADASPSAYFDANTGDEELDRVINQANGKLATVSFEHRAQTTALALQNIASHLSGLSGRKNLIWLSGGFPVALGGVSGPAIVDSPASASWRVFDDVGLAIYPVDVRGLIGMTEWMPSQSPENHMLTVIGRSPVDRRAQRNITSSEEAMISLADRTGGRACLNNNDIAGCVRRAMDDARVTYTLYYTPTHSDWNGKFHNIKISLKRRGLQARYRKGYYALPEPAADPNTRQSSLAAAAMSPLLSTGLTLVARLAVKPTGTPARGVLSVVADAQDITFGSNAQGQRDATLDIQTLFFGDQPAPLLQSARTVHLALKREEYDRLTRTGIPITMNVEAPPGSERVRVVVRDAASSRLGSLDVPLQ